MRDYSSHGLEQMLTTTELAEYLGVASQAIYDLRSAGQGPSAIHIGRELRFRVADVRSWIDSRSESTQSAVRDDR